MLIFTNSVLGWSSFVGVAVVLFAYLVTWPLANLSIKVRVQATRFTTGLLIGLSDHAIIMGSERSSDVFGERTAAIRSLP